MVSKNKTGEQKGKVKVDKLKVNKETVKNLSEGEKKRIQGGAAADRTYPCPSLGCPVSIVK